MKILILSLLLFSANSFAINKTNDDFNFVVLSDIHIYTSGKIPAKAKAVIKHILNLKPDFVFITGDHTNGNRNDGHQLPKITSWYRSLNELLSPLTQNNIPIFPTVGNHDYYEPAHKLAYDNWAKQVISRSINLLGLEQPKNYLSFPFKFKNSEFFVLNLWRQKLGSEQTNWIKSYSSSTNKSGLRFAFGHVPLRSTIGRTSSHFYQSTSAVFEELQLDAYICGHEHLHWDEINPKTNSFRQIIVGTASGTYNFPIRRQMAELHCGRQTCLMPATKKIFKIKRLSNGAAEQQFKQNWLHVKVNGTEYTTDAYALDLSDDAVNFYVD